MARPHSQSSHQIEKPMIIRRETGCRNTTLTETKKSTTAASSMTEMVWKMFVSAFLLQLHMYVYWRAWHMLAFQKSYIPCWFSLYQQVTIASQRYPTSTKNYFRIGTTLFKTSCYNILLKSWQALVSLSLAPLPKRLLGSDFIFQLSQCWSDSLLVLRPPSLAPLCVKVDHTSHSLFGVTFRET